MTTLPARLLAVTPDGPVELEVRDPRAGVHEALAGLPNALYSALRTFHHERFLWLEEHLARIERNRLALGWERGLDEARFRSCLAGAVREWPGEDCRVRFDLWPEPVPGLAVPTRTVIALSPVVPIPREFVEQGVGVAVTRELRRERPRIKTTDFVARRKPLPMERRDRFEDLMLDDAERIGEGSSSNFFGVRGGLLLTAADGVLEGITRKALLHLAQRLEIPVRLEAIPLAQAGELDEAFLTSSSRGLIPIVTIGGTAVGDGRPGPVSRRLLAAYADLIEREARPALPAS
jgi:branched-subunit amino acid aminotransferase/4-amino-4-deoxychorismate lyase